jgi:hypothetical protein
MDEMGAARCSVLVRKGSLKQEKKQLEKHPSWAKHLIATWGTGVSLWVLKTSPPAIRT